MDIFYLSYSSFLAWYHVHIRSNCPKNCESRCCNIHNLIVGVVSFCDIVYFLSAKWSAFRLNKVVFINIKKTRDTKFIEHYTMISFS